MRRDPMWRLILRCLQEAPRLVLLAGRAEKRPRIWNGHEIPLHRRAEALAVVGRLDDRRFSLPRYHTDRLAHSFHLLRHIVLTKVVDHAANHLTSSLVKARQNAIIHDVDRRQEGSIIAHRCVEPHFCHVAQRERATVASFRKVLIQKHRHVRAAVRFVVVHYRAGRLRRSVVQRHRRRPRRRPVGRRVGRRRVGFQNRAVGGWLGDVRVPAPRRPFQVKSARNAPFVKKVLHDHHLLHDALARDAVVAPDLVHAEHLDQQARCAVEERLGEVLEILRGVLEEHLQFRPRDLLAHETPVGRFEERGARLAALGVPRLGRRQRLQIVAVAVAAAVRRPHRGELRGPVRLADELAEDTALVVDVGESVADVRLLRRYQLKLQSLRQRFRRRGP
mmetsp:Transcript_25275/g.84973  ORF Transcript_25275/g.84973 Transcript_25275/m.84973 type:complete len:391 (-) Transcript_25275:2426-3598(-)